MTTDPAVESWRETTFKPSTPCPYRLDVMCGGDQVAGDCGCIEAAEYERGY